MTSEPLGGFRVVGPPLPEPPPLPERRVYPNPPIVEGLVQFNFATPIPWNVATPGRVFERLQPAYPRDPETQGTLQAAFNPQPGSAPDFTVTHGGQRVIYKSDDETRLLVLNEGMLSLNSLKPYEGWEALEGRIRDAIDALNKAFAMPEIAEVSVRYINHIQVPRGGRTEDFFRYEIHTVRAGASYLLNFVHRVESVLPDGATTAGTTFASAQPQTEDFFGVILDIEFKRRFGSGISIDQALEAANELKKLENGEFETVITDRTRELFQ